MPPLNALRNAGAPKRSLAEKLGIRPGARLILLGAPQDYEAALGRLPDGVETAADLSGRFDLIQLFTLRRAELDRRFPALRSALRETGALWISWPKRSAKLETDLDENVVREVGLAHGLVDVKVCAVDATWSGLKFVVRRRDRKGRSG